MKTLAVAAAFAAAAPALAQSARIGGDVIAATPTSLTIRHASGETVAIDAPASVPVQAFKNMTLADVKPGSFVGVGAKIGPDGVQRAVQVVIFPESARGTGEGHRGWNMGPDSTMTNANVDAVVGARDGRNLKLSYKGGTQEIVVPPEARILTFVPATRADVKVGRKAVVNADQKGDRYVATRITVEKGGVVPPM
ncbi:hypothetical protein GCM10023144_08220 [Pigmentiphaga soli]|uniref:DUF5666 domain-containing protein n=1 Tax=Pigmentiphaga soli TaxID=1007095 RepID=A0ABP8GJQ1_9BURK